MRYLTSLLLIISFAPCFAISDAVENLLLNEEETYHATELYQQLDEFEQNPININLASVHHLQYFLWISEDELNKILQSRQKAPLRSLADLKKLGIPEICVDALEPYIRFSEPQNVHFSSQLRCELVEKKLKEENPLKLLQKMEINYSNQRLGFITQKDAQEKNYLDYYSYYWEIKRQNFQLILGKYRTFLGQGIMFAPKLGISKSAAATSVKSHQSQAFRPYTSTYEIWGLQGAAANWKFGNYQLAAFGSISQLTANLDGGKITSFDATGIHLDADKKNNVTEIASGIITGYQTMSGKIELYLTTQDFDLNFVNKSSSYSAVGADFFYEIKQNPLFGEICYADDQLAMICGNKWGEENLRHLLIYRNYPNNFPTWHGKPFSAQSNFSNERGLYYGITYIPKPRLHINAFFDFWQHPNPRFLEKMPTSNGEQLLQAEYKFSKHKFRFRISHKQKEKQINLGESAIREYHRTTYRFDWSRELKPFTLQHRFEFSEEYLPEDSVWEKGELFYSQLRFKKDSMQIIGRIAAYHSNILLYMYENNVTGIMQNRILSGDGVTVFVVGKFTINEWLEIQTKFSDNLSRDDQMQLTFQLIGEF